MGRLQVAPASLQRGEFTGKHRRWLHPLTRNCDREEETAQRAGAVAQISPELPWCWGWAPSCTSSDCCQQPPTPLAKHDWLLLGWQRLHPPADPIHTLPSTPSNWGLWVQWHPWEPWGNGSSPLLFPTTLSMVDTEPQQPGVSPCGRGTPNHGQTLRSMRGRPLLLHPSTGWLSHRAEG